MTQSYEITFIMGETADEAAAQAKLAGLTSYLETQEATVTKSEFWGRRELAYPIARNRSGFYVTFWADLPRAAVMNLEKEMKFDESIIRSLVTKAYVHAQPGSLYPVVEEEKDIKRGRRSATEEKVGAEAELRAAPAKKTKAAAPAEEAPVEEGDEEDRMQQLDAALDGILKEETTEESK
jgi:small subunit ribosomal protein S6